ncbi:MAG TPA: hypothetical protein VFM18_13280, partial [Methanosarcina sp.]|nr:hypothetical protein [Methanosarcina sp.]
QGDISDCVPDEVLSVSVKEWGGEYSNQAYGVRLSGSDSELIGYGEEYFQTPHNCKVDGSEFKIFN